MSRKKLTRINIDVKENWKNILKSITHDEIPIEFLNSIRVTLIDGTKIVIGVADKLDEGSDPDELQDIINMKLNSMSNYIKDVDMYINIDSVANIIDPMLEEVWGAND